MGGQLIWSLGQERVCYRAGSGAFDEKGVAEEQGAGGGGEEEGIEGRGRHLFRDGHFRLNAVGRHLGQLGVDEVAAGPEDEMVAFGGGAFSSEGLTDSVEFQGHRPGNEAVRGSFHEAGLQRGAEARHDHVGEKEDPSEFPEDVPVAHARQMYGNRMHAMTLVPALSAARNKGISPSMDHGVPCRAPVVIRVARMS